MGLPDMFTTTYTNEMIDEWLGIKKDTKLISITTEQAQNNSKNTNSTQKEIEK